MCQLKYRDQNRIFGNGKVDPETLERPDKAYACCLLVYSLGRNLTLPRIKCGKII